MRTDTHWKHIGKNIATLRTSKGMSMQDLGDRIGEHRQNINAIEKGRKPVSLDRLVQIAGALGCNLDIIFTPK